ncbi:MAG TPA: YceI family protein [Candidatus Angelobacter sp.]|jgi:polyisoprenoid-binding protein YceI|nr:YceI family protein [Candidatus Angelobacter sp.]
MRLTVRAFRDISFFVLLALLSGKFAQAQQKTFTLDPAQTKVNFTVDSTFHTVHGDFRLKRGLIQFDNATGVAGGELVVDAASGESGSDGRDKKMHKDILESPKYSDIVFTPQHIKGTVATEGKSAVEVEGILIMHGKSKPVTMPLEVQMQGGTGSAEGSFSVKYKEWGMKNPSTFVLRVNEKVEIHVHAVGRLAPGSGN